MPKGKLKTVAEVVNFHRQKVEYRKSNELYPALMNFALERHMEKENKIECEVNECKEYSKEMELVIKEFREFLEKEKNNSSFK